MLRIFLLLLVAQTALAQPIISRSIVSRLEIFDMTTRQRRVVRTDTARFEAPNYTKDGRFLLINQGGKLYKVAVSDGRKTVIDTRPANYLNNDHGLMPDGKTLILSNQDDGSGKDYKTSRVYLAPLSGKGPARLVTPLGPSYWHGVSPDGQTLAYVAERSQADSDTDFDIYTIPTKAASTTALAIETRLTTAKGLDDGPDYSPDGRYIYFNSFRTGRMQIWRMNADGTNPIQLTDDAHSNWFPHPSPDGRWLLFISYVEDQKAAHPADKQVMLRLIDLKKSSPAKPGEAVDGAEIVELVRLPKGGQGTINVPCWSPDSRRFAFVSY